LHRDGEVVETRQPVGVLDVAEAVNFARAAFGRLLLTRGARVDDETEGDGDECLHCLCPHDHTLSLKRHYRPV
jgi:hypothetical protein